MSSSKPGLARQVPPPVDRRRTPRTGSAYTRFIPREELQGFASWTPDAFGAAAGQTAARPQADPGERRVGASAADADPSAAAWQARIHAARQSGYQDGYRDGLVALDSFKQSFAQQLSAQFGLLLQGFDGQLAALEQDIAASVARVATQLARQVVRSELSARPDLIVQVAQDAVNAVLLSANHITVQVNPQDQALIGAGAAEALAARGARLIGTPTIERGGCLVESDAGTLDARIEARWRQAVHALGTGADWADDAEAGGAIDGARP